MKPSQLFTVLFFTISGCFNSFIYSQVPSYVPNEVIVKWKSIRGNYQRSSLVLPAKRFRTFKEVGVELWRLESAPAVDVLTLIKQYKDHPAIEFIEPNYIYNSFETTPSDPMFSEQWGLNNTGQTGGTLSADIAATTAWEIQKESPSVKVAIIDAGIDWKHNDLVDNIWQNLGEDIDGDGVVLEWNGTDWVFDPGDENGIDDDGNGYIDDFIGWDFRNNDNNPFDEDGHGTHVAGIVGARGSNGIGITGVTWEVQLAALKIIENRHLKTSDAIEAINYAVAMDIPISNNSWGGSVYSTALYNAIEEAASQNHLFIAAIGNDTLNTDITPIYPASYTLDNIISVAASDKNDERASFSNYGATTIDLFAPGSTILSCLPNNTYGTRSGTSQAAPFVTGAAALLKEVFPNKTYLEIKEAIINSVDPIPTLSSRSTSGGRLNLFNLLGVSGVNCAYRDSLALVALYQATNGPSWTFTWDLSQPISTWYGITTNSNGCVTEIDLNNNQLVGTIPLEIRGLYNLQVLILSSNQLSGSIPNTIRNLENLVQLQLDANQLNGNIPIGIGALSKLQHLQLDHNQLSGSLPITIRELQALIHLQLNHNQLEGSIPTVFTNLNHLKRLYLNNNQLSGTLDMSLVSRDSLEWLYLNNNQLSGNINYIPDLLNIKRLHLQNNRFYGSIPLDFGFRRDLEELYLNDNQLFGTIPSTINTNNLDKLQSLRLENNQLTGCFYQNLTTLCGIDYNFSGNIGLPGAGDFADFCMNGTGGCVPCGTADSLALVALYHATDGPNWLNKWDLNLPIDTWHGIYLTSTGCVERIHLGDNQLKGSIPPEIGNFPHLKQLYLANSQLVDSIPAEIGNLTNLEVLRLYNNQLTGSIPTTIGNLSNLQYLELNKNQLDGIIPKEIGNLIYLLSIRLHNNQLEGPIPIEMGNITPLRLLYLQSNQLSGSIPTTFGNLTNLRYLSLSSNKLTGDIPVELGQLKSLINLDLLTNDLSGSIPLEIFNLNALTVLNLAQNNLDGPIPNQIANLKNLTKLRLGRNQLIGNIPPVIGQLKNLIELDLDQNKLQGTIPEGIVGLSNLEELWLSNNQLTGSIPAALGNLSNLRELLLHGNQLEGCFPENLLNLCMISRINFSFNPNLPNSGDFITFCTNEAGKCIDPVWPGDFNNDGVANNADALYWGLACANTSGPTRPNASVTWVGQEVPDWTTAVKGINSKHQDGDGNGVINEADFQVLIDNYGKTHGYESFANTTNGINYSLASNNIGGDTLQIDLNLVSDGLPINLHGMACAIDFGSLPIDTFNFDFGNSSLNPSHHLIAFNAEENVLDIALTRTDKTDTICDGQMGTLWIVIADMMDFGDDILISVKKGSQMQASGDFNAIGSATLYSNYSLPPSNTNLLINVSSSPVECDKLGSAMVNISGGLAPYDIQWSNGRTTPTITGLTEGNYSVTVTDADNREASYEIAIEGLYIPEYNEAGELVDCSPTDCPVTIDLSNIISTATYKASNNIIASGSILAGNTSFFKAGSNIILQPGFTVETGGELIADIEDCATSTLNNNKNTSAFEVVRVSENKPINRNDRPSVAIKKPNIFITPNPLLQQGIIRYEIAEATTVRLFISDVQGTQIQLLERKITKEAGQYQVEFKANNLPKGLYFVHLQTNEGITTKKMIVME